MLCACLKKGSFNITLVPLNDFQRQLFRSIFFAVRVQLVIFETSTDLHHPLVRQPSFPNGRATATFIHPTFHLKGCSRNSPNKVLRKRPPVLHIQRNWQSWQIFWFDQTSKLMQIVDTSVLQRKLLPQHLLFQIHFRWFRCCLLRHAAQQHQSCSPAAPRPSGHCTQHHSGQRHGMEMPRAKAATPDGGWCDLDMNVAGIDQNLANAAMSPLEILR